MVMSSSPQLTSSYILSQLKFFLRVVIIATAIYFSIAIVVIIFGGNLQSLHDDYDNDPLAALLWSISQVMRCLSFTPPSYNAGPSISSLSTLSGLADWIEQRAWEGLEKRSSSMENILLRHEGSNDTSDIFLLEIPVLDLETFACPERNEEKTDSTKVDSDVKQSQVITEKCVRNTFGADWKSRPLLVRGLWKKEELEVKNDSSSSASAIDTNFNESYRRRLSLDGLQNDPHLSKLRIPLYSDASRAGYAVLSPDAIAPVGEIVHNITNLGSKAKIGSQLIIEEFPDLIEEVAPPHLVRDLFGDRFRPEHVKGSGPWGIFPAQTTVPVFLAGSGNIPETQKDGSQERQEINEGETCRLKEGKICRLSDVVAEDNRQESIPVGGKVTNDHNDNVLLNNHPRTDLHCEPIGNIAVQLHGEKEWTLISPKYSALLRPSISRHGRAFFFSMLDPIDPSSLDRVPRYKIVTKAGDALWVPPWTWHRVIYKGTGNSPAFAASLFHFRPWEYFVNNPILAVVVIPNLVKELIGWNNE